MAAPTKGDTPMSTRMNFARRRAEDLETNHQRWFTEWAATQWWDRYYFHVPNERKGKLEAQILNGQGVKSGVPDILILCPAGRWHGLAIELKRTQGHPKPSPTQAAWLEQLKAQGYYTAVAWGWDEARQHVNDYFLELMP